MIAAAMHAMMLFRDIRERQEMSEGARDGERRRYRHLAKQLVDVLDLTVVRSCAFCELAYLFDACEELLSLGMSKNAAEHLPEQAHVVSQRLMRIGTHHRILSVPDKISAVSAARIAVIAFAIIAGAFVVTWLVFGFWRVRSEIRRRAAGDAPLTSARAIIWRDPGPAESLDLAAGPGGPQGAPVPPFQFVEEHGAGTFPCVSVRDARRQLWRVKWGDEVHTEVFAARLAWAAGYFVEVNYFVPSGRIEGADTLQRAGECIRADGSFQNARFELDEPGVVKHFDEHSWAWNDNPFVGTRELNGLKIVMMLLSNWDNKDVRDVARGSNTAIFEYQMDRHMREARYLI